MKNYLTEFVGTFFLVLTIGLAAASGTPMAPLAIGSVLMEGSSFYGLAIGFRYWPARLPSARFRAGPSIPRSE